MGFRSDIPSTGRDFFFSPVGDNTNSGFSDENPVATPTEAINRVNALTIPPSNTDPASIDAAVTGTYSSGITVPAFTTCNARFASIVSFDSTVLTCDGNHTVTWGALVALAPGATLVSIDGEDRVAVELNAMVTTGDGSTGINLTGNVSEIFFEVRSADINGDGSIFIDHTADSSTSVEYNLENVRFMDENETVVRYNDSVGTTATVFNVSSIQADPGAASTANSVVFDVINGTLLVDAELMVGETLALVKDGATLVVDSLALFGDTLVSNGGIGIYKSVGVITGDLETSGSGTLQVSVENLFGNVTTAGTGGVSVKADQLIGDIDIGSGTSAYMVIDNHVGSLSGRRRINGIINGRKYGNWRRFFTQSFDANDAIFPATNAAAASSRNAHPILAHDDTTAESVVFGGVMDAEYDNEDDLEIDIDWVSETATTGGVTWGVEVERIDPGGQDIDSDSFAAQQTGTSTTNATSGVITRTTITLTNAQADALEASDTYRLRVQRVVSDVGDDMAGDAQIRSVSVRNV